MSADREERCRPFIAKMVKHFGEPKGGQEVYRDIAAAIGGYSIPVIEAAATIAVRQSRFFPTVSECLGFVEKARQEAIANHEPRPLPPQDGNRLHDDAAKRLLLCDQGYMAALEGYHVRLFDFAKKEGRLPNQRELSAILRDFRAPTIEHKGKEFDRRKLWEQQPGEAPWITTARKAMLARREQLREYIMDNYSPRQAAE